MKRRFTTSRIKLRLGFTLVGAVFLCGCEDVITVDLRDSEPRLVIEGIMSNGPSGFSLSRTTDFYSLTTFEGVEGASIIVSDSVSIVDTLVYVGFGRYVFSRSRTPVPERNYYATVTVDGHTYTALTTMPGPMKVDSLRAEYQEGGGIGTEEDEGYRLHVYFQDVADRADYARIKLAENGGFFDYFYLYDGRYSDGNTVDYEYFFNVFEPGDRASVELHAMDRTMYYYFLTLSEVWASEDVSNFLDATPANPNTNWSGGALGYFGAFSISRQWILIPEYSQ